MRAGVGGPASNGKTLFTGPAQSRCEFSGERSHLLGDGGAVWSECGQRGEVVAALARQWQCCGQADGRAPAAAADGGARVAVGADCRKAGPGPCGRWRPNWPSATPRRATGRCGGSSSTRGSRLKKHCTPASRIAPTSPVAGSGGRHIRAGLTRSAWCSLTRPPLSLGQALGQDQYYRPLRALPTRRSLDRQGAAWPLAYADPCLRRGRLFLAALRHDCIAAPCVIDGPINGASFHSLYRTVPRADPQPR